jgi:hypothetical protein
METIMTLLEHSAMNQSDLASARAYAKEVPTLVAEINNLFAKHGLKNMNVHSFSFSKNPGHTTAQDQETVLGIGVTSEGLWVAAKYQK